MPVSTGEAVECMTVAAEFQKIIDRPSIVQHERNGALAHLCTGLA